MDARGTKVQRRPFFPLPANHRTTNESVGRPSMLVAHRSPSLCHERAWRTGMGHAGCRPPPSPCGAPTRMAPWLRAKVIFVIAPAVGLKGGPQRPTQRGGRGPEGGRPLGWGSGTSSRRRGRAARSGWTRRRTPGHLGDDAGGRGAIGRGLRACVSIRRGPWSRDAGAGPRPPPQSRKAHQSARRWRSRP